MRRSKVRELVAQVPRRQILKSSDADPSEASTREGQREGSREVGRSTIRVVLHRKPLEHERGNPTVVAETVVVISDIPVMYAVGGRDKPISEQAPIAFARLEGELATLRGRRFYGAVVDGEYRACVAIKPEDDLENLPHPTWTIPGGKYVRQKLADWEQHRQMIGPSIMRMRERNNLDPSRPCIEYYRSQRELLLMAPIL